MRQNITIEELLELTDENILKLSHTLGINWIGWKNIRHVADARTAFETEEFTHNSLISTNEVCTIGQIMSLINKDWFITLNPPRMDSQYDFQLELSERKNCRDVYDLPIKETFHGDELIEVLYTALRWTYQLN